MIILRLFSTRFLEDLDKGQNPLPNHPYKTLEPVPPSIQDTVIADIFHQSDTLVPQSMYTEKGYKPPEKINFLKNLTKNEGDPKPKQQKLTKKEIPPLPASSNAVAIDLAQVLYEQEMKKLMEQIAQASLAEQLALQNAIQNPIYDSIFEPTIRKMLQDIAIEELNLHNKKIKMVQTNEIRKLANEKIVNDIMLDKLLVTVAEHGRVVGDEDDLGKLIDGKKTNNFVDTDL
jgi:hypothetical protein